MTLIDFFMTPHGRVSRQEYWLGMTVLMACLYTSWVCPSRRSKTEKLSNQVMMPCSLTPFTRNTVTGVLFFRTWFRNTS